jgi:KUP system potassium uptake protein
MADKDNLHKFSAAGMMITLGIVFGDIGTSPIYVLSAIIKGQQLRPELILRWSFLRVLDTFSDYHN